MQTVHTTPSVSAIVSIARSYASYNHWANKAIVDWLRSKPAATLAGEVPSSFTTVRATLQHMWQTQRFWLAVLNKDTSPNAEPFLGTLEEVMDGIVAHSAEMAAFIGQQADAQVNEPVLLKNPWFECNFPIFEYIVQVMNHSTYHRGQVITMGRNLGFTDAPLTDYLFYIAKVAAPPQPAAGTAEIAYLAANMASYTSWANSTLLGWLRTKPAELLAQEVPSSFPSIAGTLRHMWKAQRHWLFFFRNESETPAEPPAGTTEETIDGLIAQSAELAQYIAALSAGEVSAVFQVKNRLLEGALPLYDCLLQMMNHSTYHRGQVVTIGRNLGFTDAPMTDYNFYNIYGK